MGRLLKERNGWGRAAWGRALAVSLIYAFAAGGYIVLSDLLVSSQAASVEELRAMEVAKGLGFVAVTSIALLVGLGLILARRERLRRDLMERTTELARRQGESALQVAVGAIAHDMKNMVTALEVAHRELTEAVADPGRTREHEELLGDIGEAIGRLRAQTRDLLDRVRHTQREDRIEEVDLAALARDAVHMARVFSRRRDCRIEVDAKDPCAVRCDRLGMEKALLNLVLNGVDAVAPGGHVWVRIRGGNPAMISVEDDGPGIPKELQGRVFEPFFTTKDGRGTGLGLSVVRDVVERSGGRVEAGESEAGGAGVRISIPTPEKAA